jgi:Flp pilus assembly protein TadG
MSNVKSGSSHRNSRRGRGQALTEFALVIPIFLLVLSGILDFGFMLFSRMTIINSAREGARAGVMVADVTTIPTVVQGRVISAAAAAGLTLTASNVTFACLQTTSSTYSPVTETPKCVWTLHTTANPSGGQQGDSVKVVVTYAYKSFFPLLFGSTFNLTSTVQMVLDSVTSG